MAIWQPKNDSILTEYTPPSVIDRMLALLKSKSNVRKMQGTGIRFEVDAADGSGYTILHRFGSGLEVAHSNQQRIKPLHFSFKNPHTYFGFSLILDGYIDIDIPQLQQKERVQAGEIVFRCGSVDQVDQIFPAVPSFRGLSIDMPASMLKAWQGDAPGSLNKGIHTLLHDTIVPFLRVFPADKAVIVLAEKMLKTNTETSFGQVQYEARALNLLAQILDPGPPPVAHLTRTQMRQAHLQRALDEAVEILRLEWSSPPTIATLARRTGLNERTLQDEFRDRTGYTIGEYARKQRLERARELIETKGLGVLEAAFHVGYSNPSHFSQAFKKYFGHLPSMGSRNK